MRTFYVTPERPLGEYYSKSLWYLAFHGPGTLSPAQWASPGLADQWQLSSGTGADECFPPWPVYQVAGACAVPRPLSGGHEAYPV